MKIVQVNTFPNKATGSIMMNIHKLLIENGHESYVVWGRGRKPENKYEIKMNNDFGVRVHGVYTRLTDRTGFASTGATKRLLKRLDEIKPDIIHLHNLHGYYINIKLLFNFIRIRQIRVVWTLHDCWAFTGHCAYFDMCGCKKWKTGCNHCEQLSTYPSSLLADSSCTNWLEKKELTYKQNLTIVTPSEWLHSQVEESFLKDYLCKTIYNGIDLDLYGPLEEPGLFEKVKTKYGLDSRPIILGVASEWTKRKGLDDFIVLHNMMSQQVQFVVVGVTKAQKNRLPKGLIGITRTENIEELCQLYSIADVFFNPTYEEIFGMVNLEAMACGTPVITYDSGGSPETIRNPQIGRIIKKDSPSKVNFDIVRNTISEMMDKVYFCNRFQGKEYNHISHFCKKNAEYFDKEKQLKTYIDLYEFIYNQG